MWYAGSVRVLRLTTLRGAAPVATAFSSSPQHSEASAPHPLSLYELALAAIPQEQRSKLVGPLGEILRDFLVAQEASRGSGLRDSSGLTKAMARLLAGADAVELSPNQMIRLGQRLAAQASSDPKQHDQAARILEAGRLCAYAVATFGKRGLSEGRLFQEGLRRLAEHPSVLTAEQIELEGLHLTIGLTGTASLPAWLGCLDVLARPDRPLRLLIPSVEDRPPLQRALKPLLDGMYRKHELAIEELSCPLGPLAASDEPWARFVRGLFRPRGSQSLVEAGELDGLLSLKPQPSPGTEAQAITAEVVRLLESGVPAAEIAVLAESPVRRQRLASALLRAGVPTTPLRGGVSGSRLRPLELPASLKLVLLLFEALALGLPREGLIQILTSRYLRFPGPLGDRPWLLAQALRAAGVRSLRRPYTHPNETGELWDEQRKGEPTWGLVRLRTWLATQSPEDGSEPKPRQAHLRLVAEQADQALRELTSLPETAPLVDHCRSLHRLLVRLRFFERTAALPELPLGEDSSMAELVTQVLAAHQRDQAAVEMLSHVLSELPLWAARLGIATESLSQRSFATILKSSVLRLWEEPLAMTSPNAVSLGELADVPPRTFSHLLIGGLIEGELPAYRLDDALLSDDDRRRIEHALGRPLFSQAQHANDAESLKLAVALAHTSHSQLFWPLSDEEGRPVARSLFVDEVLHAAAISELPAATGPLPPAIHPAELWQRSQQSPSLFESLSRRDRQRASRIMAVSRIEEQRSRFFGATCANADAAHLYSHPFVGRLLDEKLIGVLQPRLPGSPKHPLSASVLEDFARCPFRFFARRVLGIRPLGEGGEELDPLASGRLHHAVLETFFKNRQAEGRLPLHADEDDRAALTDATDQVLADFVRKEHVGHPELLKVRIVRLRTELWRLVENEAKSPPEPDCLPSLFEWKFGPLAIAAAQGDEGQMPLHIHGIVDRVDMGDGKAVVLDYKAGRRERYQHHLSHDLLKTSFQLPLYIAALRADPTLNSEVPLQRVTARYYSLRQGKVTGALDNAEMTTLDRAVRLRNPEGNVAEVAYHLWRRLRDGDFAVAPRTCEGCGMESVCRIGAAPLDQPSDEDGQSSQASQSIAPSQLSPTRDFVDGDNR